MTVFGAIGQRLGLIGLLFFVLLAGGCQQGAKDGKSGSAGMDEKTVITVYCENSMVPMMVEMEKLFELESNCDVKIVNDCSHNLIGLINFSKKGDLFMPDACSAFGELGRNSSVKIIDSVFLGNNQLVVLVPDDNPKNIIAGASLFGNTNLSAAIANPETGSLGLETYMMLNERGHYAAFSKSIVGMTVDSKGLGKMVQNGEADYAITWASSAVLADGNMSVRYLELTPAYDVPVFLGVLSCSANQNVAKYFMDFVSSGKQSEIIQRNGLKKRRPQVF